MRRTTCRACGDPSLEQFLDLGLMPLAGGFLADPAEARREQRYPLPVHVCTACGLVQITEVIDPDVLFQEYSFASSTIEPLVRHFEGYATWLRDRFDPRFVVEFGCNDGVLLEPLDRMHVRTCGIDLSVNITDHARANGLDVITGRFDGPTADVIRRRHGPADVVTGSNAFAHNDAPDVLLEAARRLLRPGGHLCLEVMYARDLLEQLQWDTLYHEHLTFYSLKTLQGLLERFGFTLVMAERIPMHGGALRVAASLDGDQPARPEVAEILAEESAMRLNDPATWRAFGDRIGRKIEIVRDTLQSLSGGHRIWAYGAAGKATLWVNACAMDYLEAVVDASPLRAGKLMPGTHTPIVFPERLRADPPDYVFVTAWNYASLIRAKEEWFPGVWVTPLPDLRMF